MKKLFLSITTLVLAATATSAVAAPRINPADLRRVQKAQERLLPAIAKEFGPKARLIHLFGRGHNTLVGVMAEVPEVGTDHLPPLAILGYDEPTGAVRVVDREFKYREARMVGPNVVLLEANGNLRLREPNGRERLLAQRVEGDLFPTPKGDALLAMLTRAGDRPEETSIGLISLDGQVKVVADGPDEDMMPTISPDGKTVVFVSARTTVASFYRTSLAGEEPVQITNKGLDARTLAITQGVNFIPPPVSNYSLEWVSNDVIRYNAGGGEYWKLNVRTGEAFADIGGDK